MTSKPATRKPNGQYLIESSPDFPMRKVSLFLERMVMLPFVLLGAATDGYRDEMRHMIDARPIES